jgi:hypothetical protein
VAGNVRHITGDNADASGTNQLYGDLSVNRRMIRSPKEMLMYSNLATRARQGKVPESELTACVQNSASGGNGDRSYYFLRK